MGKVSGDKARYNRQRRKKLARRVEMRALRATLTDAADSKGSATVPAKPRGARLKAS